MQQAKLRGPNHKKSMPFGPFRTHTIPINIGQLTVFDAGAVVDIAALEARNGVSGLGFFYQQVVDLPLRKRMSSALFSRVNKAGISLCIF